MSAQDSHELTHSAVSESLSDQSLEADVGFTLTKAELSEMLFDQVGLNKREAKDMVETFFGEIRGSLEAGQSVKLSGFGNFQLRDKPQRPGRNPKTGEEIPISARRVVTFHASQKLKDQIDEAIGRSSLIADIKTD
ncbi:MAG: integration host factor subunit alpha [Burkholderiaceae bacterium]